ncbi:UAA transporter [Thelephora terrestris]|uniref:UAA transporter n=1 Tax=Thelephora terrestris TaxID=56493 RepID=A0A9P6L4I8_9AGAM|nr:UAA transporter [Thelephora terrestris]
MLPRVFDWVLTLGLVFGGCCSNALTLEELTSKYPTVGHLVTFVQFLVIAIHGFPKHFTITRWRGIPIPKLKPRQIPLSVYFVQVVLFCLLSILNNKAFSYFIPMTVHIIFRSGGLIISMLMGRTLLNKRYTTLQVVSVVLVTLGVISTTLSGTKKSKAGITTNSVSAVMDIHQYLTGIALLSIALVLSGLLGVVQDRAYAKFRGTGNTPWEESMFYLHFLSMPMFLSLKGDIAEQFYTLQQPSAFSTSSSSLPSPIPIAFVILGLNVFTQLICAAGVNRLTSRVSSLTVSLILVVRKAVSLFVSLTIFGDKEMDQQQKLLLYGGAGLVFFGTVLYSIAQKRKTVDKVD